jgi:magnesium transporter
MAEAAVPSAISHDMNTIFVHRNGQTEKATSIDRAWLGPGSGVVVWVDLAAPSALEALILSDTFQFHPLSVDDAMAAVQYPKVEAYDGYLYVVLHGIDFQESDHCFSTSDIDFFLGPAFLVTVHDGHSLSITELRDYVTRNTKIMGEGPVALFHRIVDSMVDHYRPEIDKLELRLDALENEIFDAPHPLLARRLLDEKREVAHLRRIVTPERDVIARLARRDFLDISTEMSFRFRDIYDHLVRIADDAMIFQDRITGMLDAHLSNASNRLNEVMKVLTVVATIFGPPTLVAGVWGMNVPLPHFPGGENAQFWWVCGGMLLMIVAMLFAFRRKRWI